MFNRLDRDFIYKLYRTYGSALPSLRVFDAQLPNLGRAYHKEERKILYMMARHFAPDWVIEFSPKRGLTTLHAALALEHNGRGRILSFELRYSQIKRAYHNLRSNGLGHRVELFLGDVRQDLPGALRHLRDRGAVTGIEFMFIDSDHSADFARWYLHALFPYVRRGGLVHIHDIQTDPRNPIENLPFELSGEEGEVRQFLLENADKYEWLSIADCVRDQAYLDLVRALGGGDVMLDSTDRPPVLARTGSEWNPSLWVLKTAEQESDDVVDVGFYPLERAALKAIKYAYRKWLVARWRTRASR